MWKIQTLILVASLLFAFPAYSEVASYKTIKEKSTLKFYAINNNAPVGGEFKDFSTDIKFDPDNLEKSKIIVEVVTSSVFADYDELVETLLSKDWLATTEFPKAVFTSKKISRMPNSNNYYSDGTLELRGKTVPVILNFQLKFVDDRNVVAKGYITLHRNDYGVGQGEWSKDDVVKNEVRVEFRLVAEKE
jgi:polyisoprenoid-binding protein YceI